MRIYTREEWGARHAAGFGSAPTADEVWLHHSVTAHLSPEATLEQEFEQMRVLERIGQQRFGGGISYTFVVFPSGRVFEGTGAGRRGAHTKGRNTIARAILLAGNYEANRATPQQVASAAALLRYGKGREGYWKTARLNGGHRQAPGASTTCPGRYGMEAVGQINNAADSPAPLEDDMLTADEVAEAVYKRLTDPLNNIHGEAEEAVKQATTAARAANIAARGVVNVEELATVVAARLPQGANVTAADVAREILAQLAAK